MDIIRLLVASLAAVLSILFLAPVLIAWILFEIVGSITKFGARVFEANVIGSNQLVEFSSSLGWKPVPNLDRYYLTMVKDGVFHTVTDSQGWPDRSNISDSNVVVFGDSYAYGYGVDACATFWRQKTSCVIKSIGAPGYNMVQELILMRQLAAQLEDKLVIWFIYFGNDLYDNLLPNNQQYRSPFVRRAQGSKHWQITTEHVSASSWPNHSDPRYHDRLSELSCVSFLSDRAYSACEFLVAEAKGICTKARAKLVLMTIPDAVQLTPDGCRKLALRAPDTDSFDVDLPDKKLKEIASRLEVPIVALKDHLSAADYKQRDPHWNEQGHRQVSKIIEQVWSEVFMREPRPESRTNLVEAYAEAKL